MAMSGDDSDRRFEVVAERRRRWSVEEKRAIVEEASGPCTNVSAVARRHGIQPALLYRWKKEFAPLGSARQAGYLVPVAIVTPPAVAPEPWVQPASDDFDGKIEIAVTNGRRVQIGADVTPAALKRIVAALED